MTKKLDAVKASNRTLDEASKDLHAKGLEPWQVFIALSKEFPGQVVEWMAKKGAKRGRK